MCPCVHRIQSSSSAISSSLWHDRATDTIDALWTAQFCRLRCSAVELAACCCSRPSTITVPQFLRRLKTELFIRAYWLSSQRLVMAFALRLRKQQEPYHHHHHHHHHHQLLYFVTLFVVIVMKRPAWFLKSFVGAFLNNLHSCVKYRPIRTLRQNSSAHGWSYCWGYCSSPVRCIWWFLCELNPRLRVCHCRVTLCPNRQYSVCSIVIMITSFVAVVYHRVWWLEIVSLYGTYAYETCI